MAGESLGTIRGQMILDVKQALNAYTQARQAHISTVTALRTGAGATAASGAVIAAAGAAMVAGFIGAINEAAKFEKQLDAFSAVSNATQAEYDAIRAKALQLGADTRYSANEIADSFIELGKSGVKAQDIIDGIGEAVANLSSATDIPLADSATSLTTILNTFGLAATDAVRVVDLLAGAANSSSIDVQELITTITYAGASAKVSGISFEDLNTAIALLGKRGIAGSKAGTGLRQMLDKLLAPTNAGKEALRDLGIITADGANNLLDYQGNLKPIPDLLDALNTATSGLSTADKVDVLGKIFPITSLPTILNLLDAGSASLRELNGEINQTTALDIAAERMNNLQGSIERLRGSVQTLKIQTGSAFQSIAKFFVDVADGIVDTLTRLPAWVTVSITVLFALVGVLLIVIGTAGLFAGSILNLIALSTVMNTSVLPFMAALFTTLTGALRTATIAMWGFVSSAAANPFVRIAAVIGIIVTALIVLYNTSATFRNAVQPIFQGLQNIFQQLAPIVTSVLGYIANFFTNIGPAAAGVGSSLVSSLTSLAGVLAGALGTAIQTILPPLLSLVQILVTTLMPTINALMPIIATLGQILGAILGGNIGALSGLVAVLGGQLQNLIIVMASTLIPAIIQLVTTIIVTLIGLIPTLVEVGVKLFLSLVTAIATALPIIIGALLQGLVGLLNAVVTMIPTFITTFALVLNTLLTTIATLLPVIIQAGVQLFTGLITALVTVIPLLINIIVTLIPLLIQVILTALPLIIQAAISIFTGLIEGLVTALPQIITALIEAFIQILTALLGMLPTLIEAAITLFLGLVTGLLTALPQIITALVGAIPQIITALVNALPLIIDGAIKLFLGIVTGLIKAIPQIIAAVVKAIPQIVQALINAVPQLIDAGRQLIQGLINGVGQMGNALWQAAQRIASKAIDSIRQFFGIASPSKVFTKIGVFLIQGLVNGIGSMQRAAVMAVNTLANQVMSVPLAVDTAGLYTSMAATRQMATDMTLGAGSLGVEQTNRLLLDNMGEQLQNLTIEQNIDINVNNPEPEPASESLPNAVRKVAKILD